MTNSKKINNKKHCYLDTHYLLGSDSMIEEKAKVVTIGPGYAMIQKLSSSSCGNCHSKQGCHSKMTKSTSDQKLVRVHNPLYAQPGDEVIIGIKADKLLTSAFLIYLAPILSMLGFALIGGSLFEIVQFNAELGSILFGIIGLVSAFFFNHVLNGKQWIVDADEIQPVILRHTYSELKPVSFA